MAVGQNSVGLGVDQLSKTLIICAILKKEIMYAVSRRSGKIEDNTGGIKFHYGKL